MEVAVSRNVLANALLLQVVQQLLSSGTSEVVLKWPEAEADRGFYGLYKTLVHERLGIPEKLSDGQKVTRKIELDGVMYMFVIQGRNSRALLDLMPDTVLTFAAADVASSVSRVADEHNPCAL